MCRCIEAYRCAQCGQCTSCTHERAWFGLEVPLKRRFWVDLNAGFVNPGWNTLEILEYWVWYHPQNGCWRILGHQNV